MLKKFLNKIIGSKEFYKMVLVIVIPIALQQLLTQFVSLIDNIMIGSVGTEQMSGVAISNQVLMVFNLAVFGIISGVSIFASQYHGSKDINGIKKTFQFKWLMIILTLIIGINIFIFYGEDIISSFINSNSDDSTDPILVQNYAWSYLKIMLIGLVPFAIKEIYSTALREAKQTFVPMIAGVSAIFVNLIFNYFLIFGKFGFPQLGVEGAAIATVISRFVELAIVVIYIHIKKEQYPFIKKVYLKVYLKFKDAKGYLPRTLLLCLNEIMWSLCITLIFQCYSKRGLDIVGAMNICNNVNNLFMTLGLSLGNAIAIIIGQLLGAKKYEEAYDTGVKLLTFSLFVSITTSILMIGSGLFIPNVYKTTDAIKSLSFKFILVAAMGMPINTFNTSSYFMIRSGGKTLLTFLFDSVFSWVVRLPLAFILVNFTNLSIIPIYILVTLSDLIKTPLAVIIIKTKIWLKTII